MTNVGKAAVAGVVGYFGGDYVAGIVNDYLAPGDGTLATRSYRDRGAWRLRLAVQIAAQAAVTAATFAALE